MKIITQSPAVPVKPQATNLKSRLFARLKRVALWLMIGVVALTTTGAAYQTIATALDKRAYPPPGQMIDVGGYRLHLNCMGVQSSDGSPTVILLDGLPSMSVVWTYIQPALVETTRVCAYDRGGGGWSDRAPNPRDPEHIATELHTLLNKASISGPYVLVAHSFGGLYARMYADRYPQDVVGMVMLDSSHPDMWTRLPTEIMGALMPTDSQQSAMSAMYWLGVMRLTSRGNPTQNCPVPPQQCAENQAFNLSGKYWEAWQAEMLAPERDAQVRATGNLGAMPLIVLTAGDHSRDFTAQAPNASDTTRVLFEQTWQELQDELAALSSNSIHQVVAGAGHDSFQLDPRYYPITIEAIKQVVEAARTGAALK